MLTTLHSTAPAGCFGQKSLEPRPGDFNTAVLLTITERETPRGDAALQWGQAMMLSQGQMPESPGSLPPSWLDPQYQKGGLVLGSQGLALASQVWT